MPTTEKNKKQLALYLTFAKSETELFEFLKGKTKLAVESADIFYTPIALIESKAPSAEIDRAVVRSIALLKAQIEIIQGTRDACLTSPSEATFSSAVPKEIAFNTKSLLSPPAAMEFVKKGVSADAESVAPDDDFDDDYDCAMNID